jgi:hypothetical protein
VAKGNGETRLQELDDGVMIGGRRSESNFDVFERKIIETRKDQSRVIEQLVDFASRDTQVVSALYRGSSKSDFTVRPRNEVTRSSIDHRSNGGGNREGAFSWGESEDDSSNRMNGWNLHTRRDGRCSTRCDEYVWRLHFSGRSVDAVLATVLMECLCRCLADDATTMLHCIKEGLKNHAIVNSSIIHEMKPLSEGATESRSKSIELLATNRIDSKIEFSLEFGNVFNFSQI